MIKRKKERRKERIMRRRVKRRNSEIYAKTKGE